MLCKYRLFRKPRLKCIYNNKINYEALLDKYLYRTENYIFAPQYLDNLSHISDIFIKTHCSRLTYKSWLKIFKIRNIQQILDINTQFSVSFPWDHIIKNKLINIDDTFINKYGKYFYHYEWNIITKQKYNDIDFNMKYNRYVNWKFIFDKRDCSLYDFLDKYVQFLCSECWTKILEEKQGDPSLYEKYGRFIIFPHTEYYSKKSTYIPIIKCPHIITQKGWEEIHIFRNINEEYKYIFNRTYGKFYLIK